MLLEEAKKILNNQSIDEKVIKLDIKVKNIISKKINELKNIVDSSSDIIDKMEQIDFSVEQKLNEIIKFIPKNKHKKLLKLKHKAGDIMPNIDKVIEKFIGRLENLVDELEKLN